MRPSQARFVTACQQLLALGTVIAVLIPTSSVISLDVVITRPGTQATGAHAPAAQAPAAQAPAAQAPEKQAPEEQDAPRAAVETRAVDPEVTEVEMTAATTAAGRRVPGATTGASGTGEQLLSETEKVEGYGAVGVTWSPESALEEKDITVEVRTRTAGRWTGWTPLEYHDEHGPDPESPEGKDVRAGTDPLLVGKVDDVQARAVTADGVVSPEDMKLSVIAPGESHGQEREAPAIDTAGLDDEKGQDEKGQRGLESSEGDLALRAGSYTHKPQIFSRAQWGANERLRDKGSLRYHEVHAGFVHHTVNSNNYTRAEVPGIIRSIYAYHTQSRGWSDVGYNFLVDKFGRIWEGRAGGVGRPVVGAHTLGYNDHSFAMSAIGNFETVRPTAAMLRAYGRLFAWKLSLHGVDAASSSQRVGSRTFRAVNGHRDAGSTACPGRHLYARLGTIRQQAARLQADWSGRDRATSVAGSAYPDIVVRRRSDKRAFVLPTGGMLSLRPTTNQRGYGSRYDTTVATPDVTGDGRADLLVRLRSTGETRVRPGTGNGTFGPERPGNKQMAGLDEITPVGDLNGNGKADFVARHKATGRLFLFSGGGKGKFRKVRIAARGWQGYDMIVAGGDLDRDGNNDLLGRDRAGRLWWHRGTGRNKITVRSRLPGSWGQYDAIVGNADFTRDGQDDLYVKTAKGQSGFVLEGLGDGRYGHRQGQNRRTRQMVDMTAVNVTGSKDPDLLGRRNARMVTAPHNGTLNTERPVDLGQRLAAADTVLSVGDWDRDGHNDIVHRNRGNRNLVIHRGRAGNGFASPRRLAKGWGRVRLVTAVGDTTGDGYPDLMGQPSGGAMRIYPGNGKGFKRSYVARSPVSASAQLGLGLWNPDGAPDNAFRVGNTVRWYRGNGPGGLTGSLGRLNTDLTGYDWVLSPGDVDRDGRPDLVVRDGKGVLWVLPGRPKGFGAPKFLADGFGGYDLAG